MESYDAIEKIIPLYDYPERFYEIEEILKAGSNLPGPRANLTLAFKFAEFFEKESVSKELLDLLIKWVNISDDKAPTNNPAEFLTFCGVLSLGAHYYYAGDHIKNLIMQQFKIAMNDKRWRVKEGAAMGLQKIAEKDFNTIKTYFSLWYDGSNFVEKRAFIATLAHPPILKDNEVAKFSLEISENILNKVLSTDKKERKRDEFVVLSKGLQYALSVFVADLPAEGFDMLKKYAEINDPEIRKIIKSNLGKARLTKKYAAEVKEVLATLDKEECD